MSRRVLKPLVNMMIVDRMLLLAASKALTAEPAVLFRPRGLYPALFGELKERILVTGIDGCRERVIAMFVFLSGQ